MVSRTVVLLKVMVFAACLSWAPAGSWLPSAAARSALTRARP
jgi:hypothetical protein